MWIRANTHGIYRARACFHVPQTCQLYSLRSQWIHYEYMMNTHVFVFTRILISTILKAKGRKKWIQRVFTRIHAYLFSIRVFSSRIQCVCIQSGIQEYLRCIRNCIHRIQKWGWYLKGTPCITVYSALYLRCIYADDVLMNILWIHPNTLQYMTNTCIW